MEQIRARRECSFSSSKCLFNPDSPSRGDAWLSAQGGDLLMTDHRRRFRNPFNTRARRPDCFFSSHCCHQRCKKSNFYDWKIGRSYAEVSSYMKVRTVATSSPSGRTRFTMTPYICAIACCSWQQVIFLQPEAFVNRRRLWSEFLVSCCLNCLPKNAPLLFVGLFEGVLSQFVGIRVGFSSSRSGQTLERCTQTGLKVKRMTATTVYVCIYCFILYGYSLS